MGHGDRFCPSGWFGPFQTGRTWCLSLCPTNQTKRNSGGAAVEIKFERFTILVDRIVELRPFERGTIYIMESRIEGRGVL